MDAPKCFISYSWESPQHIEWIRMLAENLQHNGVITFLDQWDLSPGSYLTEYMEASIRDSEYVLLICTPTFAQKANCGIGGVGYEKNIVTGEIFTNSASSNKFVPILRFGNEAQSLPSYLKSKVFIDFKDESKFEKSFQALLRHLHNIPEFKRPPLGAPSFVNSPIEVTSVDQTLRNQPFDLTVHKQLVDYAYSSSGLNYSKQGAAEWADRHSQFTTQDLQRYKQMVDYAYSSSGLNYSKQGAVEWSDRHGQFTTQDIQRYKQMVDYAYSSSGLNYSKQGAAEWADQH